MKHIKFLMGALLALVLINISLADDAKAAPEPEQWVLSLGGVGATGTDSDGETAFGIDLSIGRTGHLLLPLEGGLRQSFSYATEGEDTALLSTRGYLDVTLLDFKGFDLFVGGNIGLLYGNTEPEWGLSPEAGLRFWLKKDVAILGRVEYPYDLTNGEWDDTLKYFLGFQVKF